ncbi:MAG: transposase [Thiohalomonadales bacterium]
MTNIKKSKSIINVGVDVGKQYLYVCIHEKALHWQEENNAQGIRRLLKRLSYYQVERLVMEATGRHEFDLAEAAYNKGIPVCIVKPLSVRRYAEAIGQLAKTDKIDATLITRFAAEVKPRITPKKSKNLIAIKNLVVRRRQLINLRTQEMNRVQIMGKELAVFCRRMIRHLDTEIKRMEKRLASHVEQQNGQRTNNIKKRTRCW